MDRVSACACTLSRWLQVPRHEHSISVGLAGRLASPRASAVARVRDTTWPALLRNTEATRYGEARMHLWLLGDDTPAVCIGVKPDGLLALKSVDDKWPPLVFVIKETKPEGAKGVDNTEDLYATCRPTEWRGAVWCGGV